MPALQINHLSFQRTRVTKVGWGTWLSLFPTLVKREGWGPALRSFGGTRKGAVTQGLQDVSLKVEDARLVVISGPNGSGKSTFLKNIAGLIGRKDGASGEIFFGEGGNLLDRTGAQQRLWKQRRIAYMTQDALLDRGLNVLRNVALPLIIRGVKRAEAYRIAREKLEQVGLPLKEKAYPEQLSGGERQRVALARLLAQDADILLLDEPTANLDSANSRKILSILREQYRLGKIVFLVTHDEETKADPDFQQVRMEEGRIVESEESREARSHYRLKNHSETPPTLAEKTRAALNLLLFALTKNLAPANRKRSAVAALSPALGLGGIYLAGTLLEQGIIPNFRQNNAALLGPVTLVQDGYRADTSDPLDHLQSRAEAAALAGTLGDGVTAHPRFQAACQLGIGGKTRRLPLWAVERDDPLPLAKHLTAGRFSFEKGEIYLGENRARELGLTAADVGREVAVELYFPEEAVKYGTAKLAGIVSGNSALSDAAFVPIGFVQDLLGIGADQAPVFVLSFPDVRAAAAAATKLKAAPSARGLAISAYSDNPVYRASEDYLTLVDLKLVTAIFLAAAAFQLFINAKQMTQQEEPELALRGLLGAGRGTLFGEHLTRLMALYGLGTLAFAGAYTPLIHHAHTDGISFLGQALDSIGVDWTFHPRFSWADIAGGAGEIAGLAAGVSALAIGSSLLSRKGQARSATPGAHLWEGNGSLIWQWSILNLARNLRRNALTCFVPSVAFLFIYLDTLYNGLNRDSRNNLALTTHPGLQISKTETPNDAFNLVVQPFSRSAVPAIAGESVSTGRLVMLGQLSRSQSAQTEIATVYGIDPQTDGAVFPTVARQVNRGGYVTRGGILLPEKTARLFGVDVGSEINLTAQTEGFLPNALKLKVSGLYTSPNPKVNANTAWVSLEDAQAILGLTSDLVSEVDVRFPSFEQASAAARQLRQSQPGFSYLDFLSRVRMIDDNKTSGTWLQGIFSAMMILVAGYGAYSFASTSLGNRRREIYNMQANGLSLRQIDRIISRETALACVGGGGAFTALGMLASFYMERFGVNLSAFTSDQGLMGLPLLDRIHGDLYAGRALLAGAVASLAPLGVLKWLIHSSVRPLKEPSRKPFLLQGEGPVTPDAEPDERTVIDARGLTLSFGQSAGREAVLNIPRFSVRKGEYVVVHGPSGSGKTSLLEILSAMYTPTTGQITVRHRGGEQRLEKLADDAARAKYRAGLAIIPQDLGLFDDLTVAENIAFGLKDNPHYQTYLLPEHLRQQVNEAIRQLEIDGIQDVKVSELSGGQRQRVAIARALAKSPEILLIDEATASLDHEGKEAFLEIVSRLNLHRGVTVVFVSHEPMVINQAGVRKVEIVEGQISY